MAIMKKKAVALVTGASRGIGKAIALALGREGYSVCVHYRKEKAKAERIAEEIRKHGSDAITVKGDISHEEDTERILEETEKKLGRISILVQNAGAAPEKREDFMECKGYEYITKMLEVNLLGPWRLCVEASRRMLKGPRRKRAIFWITSISAAMPSMERAGYCIAKAGASMAVKLLSARLASENIPVWEIRPGIIRTDMTARVIKKYEKLVMEGMIPMKRIGKPEDVAAAVVALLQGGNAYATGSVIFIDGGLQLNIL